jgi:hypothetical protein
MTENAVCIKKRTFSHKSRLATVRPEASAWQPLRAGPVVRERLDTGARLWYLLHVLGGTLAHFGCSLKESAPPQGRPWSDVVPVIQAERPVLASDSSGGVPAASGIRTGPRRGFAHVEGISTRLGRIRSQGHGAAVREVRQHLDSRPPGAGPQPQVRRGPQRVAMPPLTTVGAWRSKGETRHE